MLVKVFYFYMQYCTTENIIQNTRSTKYLTMYTYISVCFTFPLYIYVKQLEFPHLSSWQSKLALVLELTLIFRNY